MVCAKASERVPFDCRTLVSNFSPAHALGYPRPTQKKLIFFSVTQKIEGPNRAHAQANGSKNVGKAFPNHPLLTPKRRKQILGVLGGAGSDLVWFLAFSTKTVSVWANTKKFDSVLKKRQQPNSSERANEGRSISGTIILVRI